MSEWQPIATAPKDGTRALLIVDGEVNCGNWGLLYPAAARPAWNRYWRSSKDDPTSFVGSSPTHWMPLPAPPGDAK